MVHTGPWSVSGHAPRPQLSNAIDFNLPELSGALGADTLGRYGWVVLDFSGGQLVLGRDSCASTPFWSLPWADPLVRCTGRAGRWQNLHRSLSPGSIGTGVHAGQVRLPVVGLDGADRRQHRPGRAGTGRRGLLVERQHGGWNRGGRGRRAEGAPLPTPRKETAEATTAIADNAAHAPTAAMAPATALIGRKWCADAREEQL
jgi:hypothetical protein